MEGYGEQPASLALRPVVANPQRQRWRGIVKARHVVLAIHDYYTQRLDDQQRALDRRSQQQLAISENELWALEYIDLMHLHHISEALDSDSSGFVTIQEVNRFTVSRPRGWRYVLLLQCDSKTLLSFPTAFCDGSRTGQSAGRPR